MLSPYYLKCISENNILKVIYCKITNAFVNSYFHIAEILPI